MRVSGKRQVGTATSRVLVTFFITLCFGCTNDGYRVLVRFDSPELADEVAWLDLALVADCQVQDAEGGQQSAHERLVEHRRVGGGKHRQEHAPGLGPGQHHEQEADVDQVAHVQDDREETERAHQIIVSVSSRSVVFRMRISYRFRGRAGEGKRFRMAGTQKRPVPDRVGS